MNAGRHYYFIRPNAVPAHNDPNRPDCYVSKELPLRPNTVVNYFSFSLDQGIARIGWPDTGDLRAAPKTGALAHCYYLNTIKPYQRDYLLAFRDVPVGSVVLMPDKGRPGELAIGEVTGSYRYHHDVPRDPYECSHRLKVKWDRNGQGEAARYTAEELAIKAPSGFWRRAFHRMDASQEPKLFQKIERIRTERIRWGQLSD